MFEKPASESTGTSPSDAPATAIIRSRHPAGYEYWLTSSRLGSILSAICVDSNEHGRSSLNDRTHDGQVTSCSMPAAFSGSLKTTLNKTSHHGRSTDARLVAAAQISAPNPAQRMHKTYKTTASLPTRLNLDHFHLFLMTTNQNSHPSALNHLEADSM